MPTEPLTNAIGHLRKAALADAGLTDGQLLDAYLQRRDEAAFECLVWRHGPAVLGACRRALGNDADAEDAFQATFLVLVRKGHVVRPRGAVGAWLYGVACNVARKARADAARRRAKE
ncbi:MAG TPA: sigma factor, partial [Gemmataceae bacterium]|nr:sigma factor [Gemmataceae bacterium]